MEHDFKKEQGEMHHGQRVAGTLAALTAAISISRAAESSYDESALPRLVHEVLAVPTGNADLRTPLEKILEAMPYQDTDAKAKREVTENLDSLAKALGQGADPDALRKAFVENAHIDGLDKSWKWGEEGDSGHVCELLWNTAKTLRAKSTDDAKRYANAAVLFSVYANFEYNGWKFAFGRAIRETGSLVELAGVTAAQAARLRTLLEYQDALFDKTNDDLIPYELQVGKLAEIPKPGMPLQEVKEALRLLNRCQAHCENVLMLCRETATVTWDLLNLARDRENKAAVALVEAEIRSWQTKAKTDHLKRWLKEALERKGPPPEGNVYVGQYIMLENGRIVPQKDCVRMPDGRAVLKDELDPKTRENK